MTREQVADYRTQVQDWNVAEDNKSIHREFKFKDFKEAMGFANEVGDIAEFEGHHPDIFIHGYRHVKITLSTHAVKGLSENDFILAAKIDKIER